ncbi:uteroglobin-like isoform X2 [Trichosurus vulpecula]|uniref:uteroglobin-like isoform X2 n=1 Tax=Trichosurus vulpecula TaxID=9337 RepID=UPI00186AC0AC|nr:uteroglobin-like isoform X2 [Trichosurus vulpecula]
MLMVPPPPFQTQTDQLASAMKLTVVCSLVALALCCSWASAKICPTFPEVADILFKGTPQEYLEAIRCFQPDEAMEAAGKLLKAKVDTLSDTTKMDIGRLMVKILT